MKFSHTLKGAKLQTNRSNSVCLLKENNSCDHRVMGWPTVANRKLQWLAVLEQKHVLWLITVGLMTHQSLKKLSYTIIDSWWCTSNLQKDLRDLFTLHSCSLFCRFNTASVQARMSRSSSLVAVFLLAFVPCLVFSAEIPNLQPGDEAPSFVLQAKDVRIGSNDVLLKYKTGNDSNLAGPVVFLAYSNRSGFLERLFSDPDSFKELLENSPDNTNYVFLFYAASSTTVKGAARGLAWLAQKFESTMQAYFFNR